MKTKEEKRFFSLSFLSLLPFPVSVSLLQSISFYSFSVFLAKFLRLGSSVFCKPRGPFLHCNQYHCWFIVLTSCGRYFQSITLDSTYYFIVEFCRFFCRYFQLNFLWTLSRILPAFESLGRVFFLSFAIGFLTSWAASSIGCNFHQKIVEFFRLFRLN